MENLGVSINNILSVLLPVAFAIFTLIFGIKFFRHITVCFDLELPSFERKSRTIEMCDKLIELKKEVDFVCCEHCAGLNDSSMDSCSYCDMKIGGALT